VVRPSVGLGGEAPAPPLKPPRPHSPATWVRRTAHASPAPPSLAGRIQAHYKVKPTWVGMTRYAFYIVPNPESYPPDFFPRWEKY
jgi:hypothetical protein